jgi:two-component system, cell cycle sensor histidine kinase and response regulator CckA
MARQGEVPELRFEDSTKRCVGVERLTTIDSSRKKPNAIDPEAPLVARFKQIQRRELWLWISAITVTVLLTVSIVFLALPVFQAGRFEIETFQMSNAVRGLVSLILLFDVFSIYQQVQIYRVRRELLERDELFHLITENAEDMIAVVDFNGNRIYNSPAYYRVLGYTAEELKKSKPHEQIHPDDRANLVAAALEAQQQGVGRRVEYRMSHKDGSWRLLESTASVVPSKSGPATKMVVVNRDITERRQLEEKFRQAHKMEAIGRLSGGIAHDFNNLLGVIIGYAEILQEKLGERDPLRVSADEIVKAGNRAASLTRQLLAFSRQQVLESEVLDLNEIVVDIEKMLRRVIGEDIELGADLDPDLGHVKADRSQLEQLFLNLAVNARDAMPDGGKFLIETRAFEMTEEYVRSYPYPVNTGSYARVTVRDTGMGMDADVQVRIFEPFFTTKEKGKGTGLGLSTVYGVVKQSGGYIEVHSEIGKGAAFAIYFPTVQETTSQTKPHQILNAASVAHETILLVEDEDSLRTLSRNLLELSGYTVLEARNGDEALRIAKNRTSNIDLLLTDIVMPGINGRELAKKLLIEMPQLKVVYMSGYAGQTLGEINIFGKNAYYLQKPFSREHLAQKIRDALESFEPATAS